MASGEQDTCVRFYPDPVCESIILLHMQLYGTAYLKTPVAYYYKVPQTKTDTLQIFTRAKGNHEVENLPQTAVGVKDIGTLIATLKASVFPGRNFIAGVAPDFEKYDNLMAKFFASIIGLQECDDRKQSCLKDFTKIFMGKLVGLYMEHKLCHSLQEHYGHQLGNGSQDCPLCMRMRERENAGQNYPLLQENTVSEDLRIKIELLYDLMAIGYDINGSSGFKINSHVCDNGQPSILTAIKITNVSWIEAFLSVGAETQVDKKILCTDKSVLLDITGYCTLIDYALEKLPEEKRLQIVKCLHAKGVRILRETKLILWCGINDVIWRNDADFLEWYFLQGLLRKRSNHLKRVRCMAAGLSHYRCLKIVLDVAQHRSILGRGGVNRLLQICVHPTTFLNSDYKTRHTDRPACLRLLLAAGAQGKNITMAGMPCPITTEPESVLLLYAAGCKGLEDVDVKLDRKIYEDEGLEVPEILNYLDTKYKAKLNGNGNVVPFLFNLSREAVRDTLLEHHSENLFKVVAQVPTTVFPNQVKRDLLFGATLDIEGRNLVDQ